MVVLARKPSPAASGGRGASVARAARWLALGLAGLSTLSCHAVTRSDGEPPGGPPRPLAPLPLASGSLHVTAGDVLEPALAGSSPARHALEPLDEQPLPFSIVPAHGGGLVLVHADLLRRQSFARYVDPDDGLGPVVVLDEAEHGYLAAALSTPRPTLVTARPDGLCLVSATGGQGAACHALRAHFVVEIDGRIAFVQQPLVPEPEPPAAPAPAPSRPAATVGKRPLRGTTSQRSARRRAALRASAARPAAPPPKLAKVQIDLRFVEPDGRLAPDPVPTGLVFERPLMNMGLVGAAGVGRGARLLWYEHRKPRSDGRRWLLQAALQTGRLDREGKLVAGSEQTVLQGDRQFGYIEGHRDPALYAEGARSLYVGRFEKTAGRKVSTGFEAQGLDPWGAVSADAAVVAVDPLGLVRTGGLRAADRKTIAAIHAEGPRLDPAQPATTPARVAWTKRRAYYLAGDTLRSRARGGEARDEPAPLVARRSRVWWATVTPAGIGLARTGRGFVELAADGSLTAHRATAAHPAVPADALAPAPDAAPRAVQIGTAWWALRPQPGEQGSSVAVTRLLPAPLRVDGVAPHPRHAALVGGPERGLLLQLHAGTMRVSELSADGTTRSLAAWPSPVGEGFDAVERRGGGALLAGRDARGRAVAAAVDAGGHLGDVHPCDLGDGTEDARLSALPGGGAVVTPGPLGRRVAWLDDDGRPLASADWPAEHSGARCLDGTPTRTHVPTPRPGELVRVAELGRPGSCLVSDLGWTAGGELRWLGTSVLAMASRAEVGRIAGAAAPTVASAPPAPPVPAATAVSAAAPPCPADMVSVAGRFCIDRYEARLVDTATGLPLSPDYAVTPNLAEISLTRWAGQRRALGDLHARAMPLPPLLRPRRSEPSFAARSVGNARPSGYLTGLVAEQACRTAGKRLCSHDEFVTACRGQEDRDFPYGDDYEHGVCNVYRYAHPSSLLHDTPSLGHLDPRLNRVEHEGKPFLHRTGSTPACRSRWGDDAVYDLVGNLDEWVADPKGAFAGGFYSRSTRAGCDALITAHPRAYLDYSLGVRCCAAAGGRG